MGWGMGHGAWSMGHGAWGEYGQERARPRVGQNQTVSPGNQTPANCRNLYGYGYTQDSSAGRTSLPDQSVIGNSPRVDDNSKLEASSSEIDHGTVYARCKLHLVGFASSPNI
ncbi:uncharacterized protein UV8b_06527 [Ustilaginoidea virens]|uniref:Uncharacterized protein n=1 Tax=Ustilaginoidea virens TaxID=1159556 RepID=A0A8E5HVH2_USTVR|nr:uncharacterized protein UV8b_06527 [Ustilaginoidea virens]QUC22286.1 hypothetical protein UV8b_06527 [Ustilaginoidea virens]